MIRTIATEVLLFATPFALYAIFLWATKAGALHPESWPLSRLVSLAIVALILVIGSFLYFSHYSGAPPGSAYVPAHLDEQGRFVPGTTR
jgi:hypothetical protein